MDGRAWHGHHRWILWLWLKGLWVSFGSFFMLCNLHGLDLHQKVKLCVALASLQWNIRKKTDWKVDLAWSSYGYRKCMFVDSLTGYLYIYVLSTMFIIECGVVISVWRCNPISFKHMSLRCLLFDPQWTTYHFRPIFLNMFWNVVFP